jgi:hypothetical protein
MPIKEKKVDMLTSDCEEREYVHVQNHDSGLDERFNQSRNGLEDVRARLNECVSHEVECGWRRKVQSKQWLL